MVTKKIMIDREIYTLANRTGQIMLDFALGMTRIEGMDTPTVYNFEPDEETDQYPEVMQFFVVSDWFAEQAKENGGIIIETDDLSYWCRTCCGVSIEDTNELNSLLPDIDFEK